MDKRLSLLWDLHTTRVKGLFFFIYRGYNIKKQFVGGAFEAQQTTIKIYQSVYSYTLEINIHNFTDISIKTSTKVLSFEL